MPRVPVTRRSAIAFGLFVLSAVAFLYFVLPKLAGLSSTAHRIERGDTWWIVIGVFLEICSFAGYVVLFRAVFVREPSPIGWPRATRSRWRAWPRRACSRPRARAASRSPPGRCVARGWSRAWWPAGWSPSWCCCM